MQMRVQNCMMTRELDASREQDLKVKNARDSKDRFPCISMARPVHAGIRLRVGSNLICGPATYIVPLGPRPSA